MIRDHVRRLTQVITALLYNCHITGFAAGSIYQGNLKTLCVPGLNCYGCPGAVFACPIGSLQSALASYKFRFPYYVLGMLLLMGVLFGRFICGFLCPFGLIQDLLDKIPTKKLQKNEITRKLSYVKYVILAITVVLIPLIMLVPGFCKYICPMGTLSAGIPIVIANPTVRAMVGWLFSWKVLLLIAILVSAVFIFRSFCRFLCPLGALYSLFNRIAFARVEVDQDRCDHCGKCTSFCRMDIRQVGDHECIQCGECRAVCPQEAIYRSIQSIQKTIGEK